MPNPPSLCLTLLTQADARKRTLNLPYQGAMTPSEVHQLLQADAKASLIDVRTHAELDLVGRVPGALHVEWARYPGMVANPDFAETLTVALANLSKDQILIFMCRAGARSHQAATVASTLGFRQVYNMLEGFEGDANAEQQRTLLNGWRFANLPWTHAK